MTLPRLSRVWIGFISHVPPLTHARVYISVQSCLPFAVVGHRVVVLSL